MSIVKCRSYYLSEDRSLNFIGNLSTNRNFMADRWNNLGDREIHSINFSVYPSPCQCRCFYCTVPPEDICNPNQEVHSDMYEKVFDIIERAQKEGMIATDVTWLISSGEITIHPYKDRILSLLKNSTAMFFTNCFIFDEKIAANLVANPQSVIFFSIDAGTHETWYRVKGCKNFVTVTDNLSKYYTSSGRSGQILLKYIILPGINDSLEDFHSIIEIMKDLGISYLLLSCDLRIKNSTDWRKRQAILRAAGALTHILYKNGMTMSLNDNSFFPDETAKVIAFANEQ